MAASRSRCVAEMMRTSMGIDWLAPTGRTARSCSTRSSLTCRAGGMSPISSSNKVPPSAAWNSPLWLLTASVKAPLTWPNSSDSSRASGMAPQLTATKGWRARAGAMDGLGQQLLARAAIAQQQHTGVRLGHHVGLGQQVGHAVGTAHDVGTPCFMGVGMCDGGGAQGKCLDNLFQQFFAVVG